MLLANQARILADPETSVEDTLKFYYFNHSSKGPLTETNKLEEFNYTAEQNNTQSDELDFQLARDLEKNSDLENFFHGFVSTSIPREIHNVFLIFFKMKKVNFI